MSVLIDVGSLASLLAAPAPATVLDVRWALGDPNGRRHYLTGHIPGAVYVDLETELAAPAAPAAGRHPLPDITAVQSAARRWGVRKSRPVVTYDDVGGTSAARAWWLLRWGGLADLHLLDGGLAAWRAAGHPVETGDVIPEPGDVRLTGGHLPIVDADGAAAVAAGGILLDARAEERYRGEVEPVDRIAGHIPGAVSAPTTDNLTSDGRFLPVDELRARFGRLGIGDGDRPVAVYCGSGVTAAHQVAALAEIGVRAALFPGSWSQWSSDPRRPVATGAEP